MDLVNTTKLSAGTIVWHPRAGATALSVVCKATFTLAQGTAQLAAVQEELHEEETYWDGDARRSVYAPCDVWPVKPAPEVLLVGSAWAPSGRPVQSLVVRIVIAGFEKAIDVHGPRLWTALGELREGARWTKMPLRYERAAGGPDTWNPVGVRLDGPPDIYGQKHLPSLQPVGMDMIERGQFVPPIAFAPIASSWALRRERARGQLYRRGEPLADGFDLSFFQDAPADQQIEVIRDDERIALEGLHPEHERLVTRLPGLRPRAKLDAGGAPIDVPLRADTLWIDTDRLLFTVTHRGHVAIADADAARKVTITLDGARAEPSAPSVTSKAPHEPEVTALHTIAQQPNRPLPFVLAGSTLSGSSMATPASAAAPPEKTVDLQAHAGGDPPPRSSDPLRKTHDFSSTGDFTENQVKMQGPAWLVDRAHAPAPPPAPPSSPEPLPPPPVEVLTRAPQVAPPSLTSASSMAAAAPLPIAAPPGAMQPPLVAMQPPPVAMPSPAGAMPSPAGAMPSPTGAMSPGAMALGASISSGPSMRSPWSEAGAAASARPGAQPPAPPPSPKEPFDPKKLGPMPTSAAFASDAAAGSNAKSAARASDQASATEEETAEPEASALELLWFDPEVVPRLRAHSVFASLTKPIAKQPVQQGKPPPPPPTPEAQEKAARSDVFRVLSKGTSGKSDPRTAEEIAEDPDAPLLLLSGELSFPFDETATMEAAMQLAKPLSLADKKLKEVLDFVAEAQKAGADAPEVARGMTDRIREAWDKANRKLPADHLDNQILQKLLAERKYQKREVLDGEWIRALYLSSPSANEPPVPTYVPSKLTKRLPLFPRFTVKMLVELYPQQDLRESCDAALKVVALARVTKPPAIR